jgi:hypothetical protein
MAKTLKIRPHLLFFIESDNDSDEQMLKKKNDTISDARKEKLTNRLTNAIRKIVKNIKLSVTWIDSCQVYHEFTHSVFFLPCYLRPPLGLKPSP